MGWFFNRTSDTATVEVQPTVPFLPNVGARLRNGMWVSAAGRIGILTQYIDADNVEVTYTKADGSTVMVLDADDHVVPARDVYPAAQVNQALIGEIPTSRYESVDQLRALGYKD